MRDVDLHPDNDLLAAWVAGWAPSRGVGPPPEGDEGLSAGALADRLTETEDCEEALATGPAGTVYLCHPFLAHAAQRHQGTVPRFMAQPPLYPAEPFQLEHRDGAVCPVEVAIRQALDMER